MIDRINASLEFQMRALALRAERQKVLAGNIANADTPNYKAVDFDFAAALRAATTPATAPANGQMARTHERHIGGNTHATASSAPLLFRNPVQPSIDNNTVDMDLERAQFADNAVRYEATLRFINGQLRTMMSAIRGDQG
jgi:flagellar basal-body rod protein FlgB